MSGIPGEGFDKRQLQLVAVTTTCFVLSTLAVVLRLVIRSCSTVLLWWDDWITALALVRSPEHQLHGWTLISFDIPGDFMAREYLHNSW